MPRLHFIRISRGDYRYQRRGFSLVEALVALTIMTMAGSVMLLAIESCLTTTSDAVDTLIADGMASQLLDEISVRRFMAPGDTPLSISGPNATESAGSGRERFNDLDDYRNVSSLPAKGMWGETLGTGNDSGSTRNANFCIPSTQFTNWRQRVDIYFVNATNHSQKLTSGTSYYRAVEVNIERVNADGSVIPLAKRRRVYAYLPPHT